MTRIALYFAIFILYCVTYGVVFYIQYHDNICATLLSNSNVLRINAVHVYFLIVLYNVVSVIEYCSIAYYLSVVFVKSKINYYCFNYCYIYNTVAGYISIKTQWDSWQLKLDSGQWTVTVYIIYQYFLYNLCTTLLISRWFEYLHCDTELFYF